MFDPKFIGAVRRVVPAALYRRLDPFEAAIRAFVGDVARSTGDGMVVLDAGAGEGRFRGLFSHARYVGVDSAEGDPRWDYGGLDLIGRLESLPVADGACDRVLSIVVLEHTAEPQRVLDEFYRVLRSGGTVHMVVPHMWEEHQRPHDYFRYTSSGVRLLAERAGFRILRVEAVGGFFWLLGRRLMGVLSFVQQGGRWILFPFLAPLFGLVFPLVCYYLDKLDRDRAYTLGYICEGRRER